MIAQAGTERAATDVDGRRPDYDAADYYVTI